MYFKNESKRNQSVTPKLRKIQKALPQVPSNPLDTSTALNDEPQEKVTASTPLPDEEIPSNTEDKCSPVKAKFYEAARGCDLIDYPKDRINCASHVAISYQQKYPDCFGAAEVEKFTKKKEKEEEAKKIEHTYTEEDLIVIDCQKILTEKMNEVKSCISLKEKDKIIKCFEKKINNAKSQYPKCNRVLDDSLENFKSQS